MNLRTVFSVLFWVIFMTAFASKLTAQTNLSFVFDPSIPVSVNGTVLAHPWAGGINYSQFSSLDYDYDGDDDLVVFDRSYNQFLLYETVINGSVSSYEYVFNSQRFFPSDCDYRTTFIDYNQDGKNDIFTYGIGGIKVYKNTGNASIGMQWQLEKSVLFTNYLGSYTNLYVSAGDIPAIVDVEGDGDLDVLTFHIGGERMEYHQNQSQELYGHSDSLIFELKNECWGQFREDPNNNNVFLNDQQSPCVNGSIANPEMPLANDLEEKKTPGNVQQKHSGSTILALDINNNNVLDLVLGDVAYTNLTLLTNGGTAPNTNSAMIAQDHLFPSNSTPASVQLFPAAYSVDVDFDGTKDLIVAPNARTVSENQKSVLFYKNNGTNSLPNFVFQTNEFLQKDMIDNGTGSIPVLVDQNGDGKKDLFVANYFRYKPVLDKESLLLLYINNGTASATSFAQSSSDYLNLSQANLGFRLVPTFGDVDGDGDDDLFLGKEDGTILRYTNNGGAGNPLSLVNPIPLVDNLGNSIAVNTFAAPQLIDLNKDNLLDLVIGKKTGEIVYYQNTGSANNPSFKLMNTQLGNVDVASTPDGYAIPHFFNVNDTLHLFVGAFDGKLHYYNDIDNKLAAGESFSLVSHEFLGINVGAYSSFFVDDCDNDGKLNLFIGQDLGGISHLEVDPTSSASIEEHLAPSIIAYPNPAKTILTLVPSQKEETIISVTVVNLVGQLLPVDFEHNNLILSDLAPGKYFVRVQTTTSSSTISFIKE